MFLEDGLLPELPAEIKAQLEQRVHVAHTFDPNAREWDNEVARPPPVTPIPIPVDDSVPATPNYVGPSLDE